MTLIKRNIHGSPWFNAFFDDESSRNFITNGMFTKGTTPAVNIKETPNDYRVELAAPGLKKENFQIELKGSALRISYKKETAPEENNSMKEVNFSQREFHYASFTRSFNLPERKVDLEKIIAQYKDGILELILPKLELSSEPKDRIISIS